MAVYSDLFLWRIHYVLLLSVEIASSANVRLYGNTTQPAGTIEIYYSFQQTWNSLCGNCWSDETANVACKELGFRGGIAANVDSTRPGIISARYDCPTGNEANLSECIFDDHTRCDTCTTSAGVLCEGAVRLLTRTPPIDFKLIEIFSKRDSGEYKWNSLCGECWTNQNADVTCKQLGYSGGRAFSLISNRHYWTTSYRCLGNEPQLKVCPVLRNRCRPRCQERAVVQCDVDGGWSDWRLNGPCSVTCGEGIQNLTRLCNNPEPQHRGLKCIGSSSSVGICDNFPCPIDGGWSDWIPNGPCSETCGEGVQAFNRSCDNPEPQYGGSECEGSNQDDQSCNEKPCPRTWNESCLVDSECADGLLCSDLYNTCDCRRETEVWDRVRMTCQSSLELLAIFSPQRLNFASANDYCSGNGTGFLATRDFMDIMFLTCMDTNQEIWLADTIETMDIYDRETGMTDICVTAGVNLESEMLLTRVDCRESRNFVCIVNRTELPFESNASSCAGFSQAKLNTNSAGIPLGAIFAAVGICVLVLLVAVVIICIVRRRNSKGATSSDSKSTELEVRYNNNDTPVVTNRVDPGQPSHEDAAPAIETDQYGYGILGKTSGTGRNQVGIDEDNFYSHTKGNQVRDSEYDVFVKKNESNDESAIYDHTGPSAMEEGQYDEFQDPKSSCENNDDFIYNTANDELP